MVCIALVILVFFGVRALLIIRTLLSGDFLRKWYSTGSRDFVWLGLVVFPLQVSLVLVVGLIFGACYSFAVVRSYIASDLCLFACRFGYLETYIDYYFLPLNGYGVFGFGSRRRRRFGHISPGPCCLRLQRYVVSSCNKIALIRVSTYSRAPFNSFPHVRRTDFDTSCSSACMYVVFAL